MTKHEARIVRDGRRICLEMSGRVVLDLPWQAAKQLGRGLIEQAGKAEEEDQHDSLAMDSAVLMAVGAPLRLTNHRAILQEAHDIERYELRKYMRNRGIPSREVWGVPAIRQGPPKREGR